MLSFSSFQEPMHKNFISAKKFTFSFQVHADIMLFYGKKDRMHDFLSEQKSKVVCFRNCPAHEITTDGV